MIETDGNLQTKRLFNFLSNESARQLAARCVPQCVGLKSSVPSEITKYPNYLRKLCSSQSVVQHSLLDSV